MQILISNADLFKVDNKNLALVLVAKIVYSKAALLFI